MHPEARRRVVGLAVLVALAALSGCSARPASSPPPEVCGTCTQFGSVAADHGVDVELVDSEVLVDVSPDGSARWTIRAGLEGPGVERLRSNETLLRAIAGDEALRADSAEPRSPRDLTARLFGDTLVVTYVAPGFASRPVGDVLVVEGLFRPPGLAGQASYRTGDYRVLLQGPSNATLARGPAGGRARQNSVVWSPKAGSIGHRYPVFVVGDAGTPAVEVGVAAAVAGWAGVPLVGFVAVVGTAVLLLADALVARTVGRAAAWRRARRRIAGRSARRERRLSGFLDGLGVAVATLLLAVPVALGLAGSRSVVLAVVGVPVVPVLAFGALGVTAVRRRRFVRTALGVLFGAVVVGGLAAVLEYGPPGIAVATLASAPVTLVVGAAGFLLARRVARGRFRRPAR